MDLEVNHQRLERDIKDEFRKQWRSTMTYIPTFNNNTYEGRVHDLGANIYNYLYKEDPAKARKWVNSINFDFNDIH